MVDTYPASSNRFATSARAFSWAVEHVGTDRQVVACQMNGEWQSIHQTRCFAARSIGRGTHTHTHMYSRTSPRRLRLLGPARLLGLRLLAVRHEPLQALQLVREAHGHHGLAVGCGPRRCV
jgi:hypothetical protein